MLAFWFTSHHDPHFATGWCVTLVFLHNGWFVTSAQVFCMVGGAIDQYCLRTDHPIKSGGASVVWWFDPDKLPNLGCITSDFMRRQFRVSALQVLLILVYVICWHVDGVSLSLGVVLYWATWPRGNSLDSVVTLRHYAITFRDVSTLVSHLYAPFIC